MMDKYTKGYLSYIEETKDIDMSQQYELFIKYVPKGSLILDAGFGSGRDIAFFKQHYDVVGIDISRQFVDYVQKNIHQDVARMDILYQSFNLPFDAIWACASLVHFDQIQLRRSFEQFHTTLKEDGILYVSFKTNGDNLFINNVSYTEDEFSDIYSDYFELIEQQLSISNYNDQSWNSYILLKV